MHPTPCPPRVRAALPALLLVTLLASPAVAQSAAPPPELEPFEPFLDRTWKGLVDPDNGVHDVAYWERALNGQAIRMRHSVGDGVYGGETFVVWDPVREAIVYYYFTTAGFYTSGTIRFDEAGRMHSRETVSGNEDGITEVDSIAELLPDGRMRVSTRMLRGGVWEAQDDVIYEEDPAAELILH